MTLVAVVVVAVVAVLVTTLLTVLGSRPSRGRDTMAEAHRREEAYWAARSHNIDAMCMTPSEREWQSILHPRGVWTLEDWKRVSKLEEINRDRS